MPVTKFKRKRDNIHCLLLFYSSRLLSKVTVKCEEISHVRRVVTIYLEDFLVIV